MKFLLLATLAFVMGLALYVGYDIWANW